MKHYGDITKLSGYDLPIVDVITGGSPCQDLSVAGLRKGMQHADKGDEETTRSGLFMDQIRIVKEMREHDRQLHSGRADELIRPRYMVWENVPGAFSSNKGKDYQAVLTEIVRIVKADAPDVPLPSNGKWSKAGVLYGVGDDGQPFSVAWRLHDAQYWGVPQRRKRLALLADFNGLTAGEILLDPQYRREAESTESDSSERDPGNGCRPEVQPQSESVSWNTGESGQEGKGVTADSERGTGESDIEWAERELFGDIE